MSVEAARAFVLLQLADSGFPAGGFAHSGGLEAAHKLGQLAGEGALLGFAEGVAWQCGYGALPFVCAAHREPERIDEIDARCHAMMVNHVTRAASRTQGRAFISTCAKVFGGEAILALDDAVRARRIEGHHAPLFGAALRALELTEGEAARLFLFATVRQVLSAAVRLGLAGPHEGAAMQASLAPLMERVLVECREVPVERAAQTAPRMDLYAGLHDQLDARMFQS